MDNMGILTVGLKAAAVVIGASCGALALVLVVLIVSFMVGRARYLFSEERKLAKAAKKADKAQALSQAQAAAQEV